MPDTKSNMAGSGALLNALASAASAAQDQALHVARTAVEIHVNSNMPEVAETLASQLQAGAIDVQLRLQMILDAAVKLGATRPIRLYGADVTDLSLKDTPASRRLLEAMDEVTAAAKAVDEEMGWVDEQGRAIGHYERYAIGLLLLRGELGKQP